MNFCRVIYIFMILFAQCLWAIDYVVNLPTDDAARDGGCGSDTSGDLRYVLNQILNNQVRGGSSETYTIRFDVPEVKLSNITLPINLLSSETVTIGNSSGILTLSNSNAIRGAHNLTFVGAGDTTVSGIVEIGGHTLTHSGSGTLTLNGMNTYSGGTAVNSGVLNVQNSLALGAGVASVTNGAQLQLEGSITTTNPLILSGSGSGDGALLNVSGRNTCSGGIILSAPTTIGSNADTLILSNSDGIEGEYNLTFIGSGDTIVKGAITTATGTLTKAGSGMLSLFGSNTYLGGTTVAGGRLSVNGQILGGVTVSQGGRLEGTGTIYGGGTIYGMLYPGNSIGTITFDTSEGDLNLDSSSITTIEIDPTDSSKIVITGGGSVSLNDSTLNIVQNEGRYSIDKQYPILEGPYIGEFNPVITGGLLGCRFNLAYDTDIIFLQFLSLPFMFSTGQFSGNDFTLAKYLNENGSGSILYLFENLNQPEQEAALSSISPARNAFGTYVGQQTACSLSGVVTDHMDIFRSEGVGASNDVAMANLTADASGAIKGWAEEQRSRNKYSVWGSGFGQYAHQSAADQNPAFNYFSAAALLGFDYRGENRSLFGGALGYAYTRLTEDDNFGHADINYYFVSVYGNFFLSNFYFSPAVWWFFDDTHNTRQISFPGFAATAKANSSAWQFLPHLEIGYNGQFSWGSITPFSSLDWVFTWQDGYQEQGASPFNASSSSKTSSMLWSETGLKFSEKWEYSWGAIFLREKLSYAFQTTFGTSSLNSAFLGTPGSFTVVAVSENLNLGVVELHFITAIGKERPVKVGLSYEGAFGSNYWTSDLILTISKSF